MKAISKILSDMHPWDRGFLGIVALYTILSYVSVWLKIGDLGDMAPHLYLWSAVKVSIWLFFGFFLYLGIRFFYILYKDRLRDPEKAIWNDLKDNVFTRSNRRRIIPLLIGLAFMAATFLNMKLLIPAFQPFSWDKAFMILDQKLHIGTDPWSLLQPLFFHPLVTHIVAFLYISWLYVTYLVLYWQAFSFKDGFLRMQFFYTFVLSWAINGTLLAIIFSSAGPCFYEALTGSEHFKPLMDYLRSAHETYNIYALPTQEWLWEIYLSKGAKDGGGISAFPSVHVSTAFLFVLAGYHANRLAFFSFLAFFFVILVGSIHLGWHYAVDGYAAIPLTWALWRFSGFLLKKSGAVAVPGNLA
jgi:hypothetical protein